MLHRYRLVLLAWLAAATPLHAWTANVFLNLTDSTATPYLSSSEINWARLGLIGAAAVAALNYIIMFTLVRRRACPEALFDSGSACVMLQASQRHLLGSKAGLQAVHSFTNKGPHIVHCVVYNVSRMCLSNWASTKCWHWLSRLHADVCAGVP